MQDKHIDEIDDLLQEYEGVIHYCGQDDCAHQQSYNELRDKLEALITTEQLAIWNKALELVGEDDVIPTIPPDGNINFSDEYLKAYNFLRWQLRSAIQQQINNEAAIKYQGKENANLNVIPVDKIGGKG